MAVSLEVCFVCGTWQLDEAQAEWEHRGPEEVWLLPVVVSAQS